MKMLSRLIAGALCLGHVWVGIGAVAAYNGASWQTGALLGIFGITDSALYAVATAGLVSFPAGLIIVVGVGL